MGNKNTIFIVVLVSICVLSVFFALFLFKYVKKIELEYTEKEAGLIRESMDLQDRVDSMEMVIAEKTKEIDAIEHEKGKLVEKVTSIEEENKKLEKLYMNRIKALEGEKEELARETKTLKQMSLVEFMRKAKEVEKNENIRNVLKRTLYNIELIKSGNVVDLEPIVVSQEKGKEKLSQAAMLPTEVSAQAGPGKILSVDGRNNLIVINLGARDRVREGQRLAILDGGEKIASGEIINSRYRISAAFIDDIKYKHTIRDIKDGYKIVMGE